MVVGKYAKRNYFTYVTLIYMVELRYASNYVEPCVFKYVDITSSSALKIKNMHKNVQIFKNTELQIKFCSTILIIKNYISNSKATFLSLTKLSLDQVCAFQFFYHSHWVV